MADKRQGYLQKAKRQMKKKGTVGAFTEYCGGKVTNDCIERALNSNDDTLRKRAQFAKNMRNLEMGGSKDQETKKLPGGIMKPIGHGAFKFMGNKHDEAGLGSDSGIILEEGGKKKPGLEVEDGELQVDVDTKDGEKEYIVSDYLINPATGNTLAEDLEKELKRARNQEEADAITAKYVKLNEKLRGEEGKPEKIKAQEGEFTSSFDELPPEYEGNVMTSEDARIGENFQHLETEGENAGLWGGVTKKDIKRTKDQNPWYDFPEGFDGTDSKENEKFQQAAKDRAIKAGLPAPEVDGKFGLQTASIRLDKPAEEVKKLEAKVESATPEAKLQGEKKDVEVTTPSDKPDRVKKERGPKLPYAGTPFQAFGDIAGLLKNYDVTPNLMAPAYAKEIRMGRVNLDPERAAAAQQTQATSQGITSGLAGPAAFAMQQKNLSAGQQGQRGITDQENRANIQIAGQEKGTNVGIRQGNQQASMTAGQYNAAAKDRAALTNRDNKMYKTELAQNVGDTAAQTIADNQQIRGDFFQAQASQVDGEFDRAYQTYGFNPRFGRNVTLRPEGGTTLSPEQIQATYRNAMAEQQTTQSRRGSYTTKPGKIKRKKRKR